MTPETNDILQTFESYWKHQAVPLSIDMLNSLQHFCKNKQKSFSAEEKAIAALTQCQLLRSGNQHVEADNLVNANRKRFDLIAEPLFAHRWQRMQLVTKLRENKAAEIHTAAQQLAEYAEAQGWYYEHMRALVLLHLVEMEMGLFKKAIETAALRKQLATGQNDIDNQREAVVNIAHTYQRFKHKELALKELENARSLFGDNFTAPMHMHYYLLLATCYQDNGATGKALPIYKNILAFLKDSGVEDTSIYIAATSNMAAAYSEKGDYAKAEEQYLQLADYTIKHKWPHHRLNVALLLCDVYRDWKKYDKMLGSLKIAEQLQKEVRMPHMEVSVLQRRAEYEKAAGDPKVALQCFEKYFRRHSEWKAIDDAEKIKALELKHELQHEQFKQELMKKENQLQQQELQMLNSFLEQKDKLIQEFALHYKELEATGLKRKAIFERLNEMVRSVKFTASEDRETYNVKFNEGHLKMVSALQKHYPKLSNTEAKIAVMLTQGLTNKEISGLTLTTVRNIEATRLRMRKKMDLKRSDDLLKKIREGIE